MELDEDLGSWPQSFTQEHHSVYLFWHYLAVATATLPVAIASVVAAIALAAKKHRRAAIWTVGVMASVMVTTTVVKRLVERERPVWDDPIQVLDSFSYPSGARVRDRRCHGGGRRAHPDAGPPSRRTTPGVRPRAGDGPARRRRPDLPGRAQRLRRGRGLSPRRRHPAALAGALRPDAPVDRGGQRPADRGGPQLAQEARRHPQPGPRSTTWGSSGCSSRTWRRTQASPRSSGGRPPSRTPVTAWRTRPRSLAATWSSRSAGTAPSALSARSWPGPASPSGSSPPAPATCWRATSTSRSTSARRSTSR